MTMDPCLVADFGKEEFTEVGPFPHPTQMSVMPVVALKGQNLRAVGTCFAISSHGLVITARHVLEEALQLDDNGKKKDQDQWVGALYVSKPALNDVEVPDLFGGMLPAKRTYWSPSLDIAVMQLVLPKNKTTGREIKMPLLPLSTAAPRQGEICVGLGYHKMNWTRATESDRPEYEVAQSYSASRGSVKSVHHASRDSVMLPFPCFETDCRFDPGMSGGPVIGTDSGNVIGVVCSSIDGQRHISYASIVGPSLLIVMESNVGSIRPEKRFLYDFVKEGAVLTDQKFSVSKDVYTNSGRELEIDFDGTRVSNAYQIG